MEEKNMKIIECKFDGLEGKCIRYSCRTDAGTVIPCNFPMSWVRLLGNTYILSHLTPEKVGDEWEIKLSWEDYYNDPERNRPRTRKLKWVGFDCARGCDFFEDTAETGKCCCRWEENGVRWYDLAEETSYIKPNVTFVCPEKGICEKIRYDDELGLIAEPVE